MNLVVIILAAGKGKRMISSLPKVLHPIGGKPMLERVVRTAQTLNPHAIHVIHGNGGDLVKDYLNYLPVNWVEQQEQLGTGHAVLQALPLCGDDDQILVLYGDVPLISSSTLNALVSGTPRNGLGLVIAELENPTGMGRIIRNELGNIIAIVEERDATPEQLKIDEINTGILTTTAANLKRWLPQLKNNNKQEEYYLTDTVELAVKNGMNVGGVLARCEEEILGVNDRWQLANRERYFQLTRAKELTFLGVTLLDPTRVTIRGEVDIEGDVTLDAGVILEGKVIIKKNSYVGSNVVIRNSIIGENVMVEPNCVIEGAIVENDCKVGPFAHLRQGTQLKARATVGNFVELKKTTLGEGSKASHLTYLGDCTIGREVNIGAGTITCNYDGVNKWQTVIADGAFIGSNTSLVAPVTIGRNATIGAGSTITENVAAQSLALGRARQTVIENWQRPAARSEASQKTETSET